MAAEDVLVSTQWVADHAGDANVKLIEVDVDTNAYGEGHPQNSIAWNWTSQLQDQTRRDIISRENLEKLLREAGVNDGDTIVLYGDNNNWFAAYAYWMLEMYGLKNLKLMDGGRKKWLEEQRPTTTVAPTPAASNISVGAANQDMLRARRDQVLQRGANSALVDVRSPAEYNGEIMAPPGLPETAQRMGHIPGAANVPWGQAVKEDGTFKSKEELAALYGGKGVSPDKDVIAYCRIGERSSHTWFALKHLLDFPNVRNYDGSWTEYGSMIDVPVEKA